MIEFEWSTPWRGEVVERLMDAIAEVVMELPNSSVGCDTAKGTIYGFTDERCCYTQVTVHKLLAIEALSGIFAEWNGVPTPNPPYQPDQREAS